MKKILFTVIAATSLLFTACYSLFEPKIGNFTGSSNTSLADLLTAETRATKLQTPGEIYVSSNYKRNSISVYWQKVENATSYHLERAIVKQNADGTYNTPDENDFSVVRGFVYTNVYEDVILKDSNSANEEYTNRYYYRVCANNYFLKMDSSDFTSIKPYGTLFAPPKNLEADKGKSKENISIKWERHNSATSYILYRSESDDYASMAPVKTLYGNQTSYKFQISEADQGKEFYFAVKAVNSNGNESEFSNVAMGYSLKEGAPVPPDNLKVTNGNANSTKELSLSWTPISFSESGDYTYSYSIFRTSSEDSTFTSVKTNINATETTCTDSEDLKPNVTYYYYIQTIAKHKTSDEILKSPFSQTGPDSTTPAKGYLLSPVQDLEILETDSSDIILKFSKPIGAKENSFTYEIYAADTIKGPYEQISVSEDLITNEDDYCYIQTEKRMFFQIVTVKETNSEENKRSEYSNKAAPLPEAPTNVVASKTLMFASNLKPNDHNVYPVKITWKKNPEAAGYYVYRSTNPDTSFRKITETMLTTSEYIDNNEGAFAGILYYYKVVSVNALGQGKKGNDTYDADCRGYGALTPDEWFREYNKTTKHSQTKLTLMHKSNDLDKLGKETVKSDIGNGTLSYDAHTKGLGAEIIMRYTNYADFYINNNPDLGIYFILLEGCTNTSASMDASGKMYDSVKCDGMYPGIAGYDNIQIKGGGAAGGYYVVTTKDKNGNIIFQDEKVDWKVGEE